MLATGNEMAAHVTACGFNYCQHMSICSWNRYIKNVSLLAMCHSNSCCYCHIERRCVFIPMVLWKLNYRNTIFTGHSQEWTYQQEMFNYLTIFPTPLALFQVQFPVQFPAGHSLYCIMHPVLSNGRLMWQAGYIWCSYQPADDTYRPPHRTNDHLLLASNFLQQTEIQDIYLKFASFHVGVMV